MNEILIRFGRRIRELRKLRGWSQEVLAEQAGFHHTYIGNVEQGRSNITLGNILKLAKAFAVDPGDLFRFLDQSENPPTIPTSSVINDRPDSRHHDLRESIWVSLTSIDDEKTMSMLNDIVHTVVDHIGRHNSI